MKNALVVAAPTVKTSYDTSLAPSDLASAIASFFAFKEGPFRMQMLHSFSTSQSTLTCGWEICHRIRCDARGQHAVRQNTVRRHVLTGFFEYTYEEECRIWGLAFEILTSALRASDTPYAKCFLGSRAAPPPFLAFFLWNIQGVELSLTMSSCRVQNGARHGLIAREPKRPFGPTTSSAKEIEKGSHQTVKRFDLVPMPSRLGVERGVDCLPQLRLIESVSPASQSLCQNMHTLECQGVRVKILW